MSSVRKRKKINDLIHELEDTMFEVASEVIADDIREVGLENFIRNLLKYVSIDIIAKAIIDAKKDKKNNK